VRPVAAECYFRRGPDRREFISLIGGTAAAWPLAARAQQQAKIRIGIVTIQPRTSPIYAAFDQRLREFGYIEGKNLVVDFVNPEDQAEGNAGAVKELVRRKVDVILAFYQSTIRSALAATDTVPIVMIAVDYDPLALGYIKSLSRPGRNITGLFLQQIDLTEKRLQVLRDALPSVQTATMFWDSATEDQWKTASRVAAAVGLRVAGVEFREQPYDYESALSQALPDHRSALVIATSPVFYRDRQRLDVCSCAGFRLPP
jgi:putative tryptophan/tyrosine transport system substrate-binding protein